jgi:hypothetical protein
MPRSNATGHAYLGGRRALRGPAGVVALAVHIVAILATVPVSAQIDPSLRALSEPQRASRRVFAVETYPGGPIEIEAVEEVKQQLPPSHYAVRARSRAAFPIKEYRLAAMVVGSDGTVKAIQPLPRVKNLKPGDARRQQEQIRVAVMTVTDRLAFALYDVTTDEEAWAVPNQALRDAVKQVALKLPLP